MQLGGCCVRNFEQKNVSDCMRRVGVRDTFGLARNWATKSEN